MSFATRRAPRTVARAPWAVAPPLLLGLLALALTLAYYGGAYHTQVRADDRILGLFSGFQSLEAADTPNPYRWTKGEGTVCLPAAGATRPAGILQLDLLGSSVAGIDRADLRLGELTIPLQIAPESRRYRMLTPPAPLAGPVCLTLISATVDPGQGRVVGVGLRSAELWKLGPAAPPYGQLAVNLWLAVGGYWLLRRLDLPRLLALALALAPLALLGAGLLGGALRVAPNLPFWSAFAAVSLSLVLGAVVAYQSAAPRLSAWQRELLGVALTAALLGVGWYAMAHLPGYFWPFPLMARAGTELSWAAALPAGLFAIFAAAVIFWLRRDAPPPAALVVGVSWLAAAGLPVALKASLRGWDSLFQTFALQEGDYIRDVPLVGADPIGFLRGYVAAMPDLALHNKTHPPGNTLFLWLVEYTLGAGPEPATWAVIALAALGVWPTYLLARRLSGWRAGTLAAAIYALLPAYMIYAATSMDALLATVLAWATWALYATFISDAGPNAARSALHQIYPVLAGLLIALGLLLSFTTLMLGLVALTLAVWRLRAGPVGRADLLRWAGLAATVAGAALLALGAVWLLSGYSSLAAFLMGVANNKIDVGERVSPLGLSSYLFFLAVNAVAYGCFLGPWLLHRLIVGARRGVGQIVAGSPRPADAVWAGAAALIGGMLLSGLFYREVERIWLFSHILLATALADGIMRETSRRSQIALAALILVGLFAHSLIFRAALRVSW
nr:glycosyltransferase family 39 protein [Oscillochloris sp. ZM17-4]